MRKAKYILTYKIRIAKDPFVSTIEFSASTRWAINKKIRTAKAFGMPWAKDFELTNNRTGKKIKL